MRKFQVPRFREIPAFLRLVAQPAQTVEIDRLLGSGGMTVCQPQHFTETFHHVVLNGVLVRMPAQKFLINPANAGWLINGQLLYDGDMHAEMKEGIGFTRLWKIIAFARDLGLFQRGMIFGMPQQHLHDQFFHAFERSSFAVRVPRAEKNLARLSAILANEHRQAVAALNSPSTTEYWNR